MSPFKAAELTVYKMTVYECTTLTGMTFPLMGDQNDLA